MTAEVDSSATLRPGFDRRVLVLTLATFASGTEAYVYAGLLTELSRDLDVSLARAGYLATAFAVTYALAAPVLASLTAAWPRRTVLAIGLTIVGLLNLAASLAPSFEWLLASRIACGLVAAIVGPSASAAAASMVAPEMRGRAMATVAAGMSLAFTVGVPIGSAIGGIYGWRSTFVFAGILLLICAALIGTAIPRIAASDRTGLATLRVVGDQRVAWRLAVTISVFTASFTSVAYLGPVVNAVADVRGFGVGLFQAVVGIGSIAGIVLGGRLADTASRDRNLPSLVAVIIVTQLGYVASQTLAVGQPWGQALLAMSILCGAMALFATMPILSVGLIEAAPDRRNVVLALNGSMVFLGQGLGAALGAAVIANDRLAHTGLVGSSLAATLTLALLIGHRRKRQPQRRAA